MANSSENISNQQQLGQLLRNHRISQEWSLEDVSSQTRLDVLVLRHLEEGNLEAPPGKVFMRGFLRIYLQFLQIPPSELELFKEVVEQRPISEEKNYACSFGSVRKQSKEYQSSQMDLWVRIGGCSSTDLATQFLGFS